MSHQDLCDVVRARIDSGLVRRIQPQGSVARCKARLGDDHPHMVCRICGTIADVDCADGVAPCVIFSDESGFVLDEAEVVYGGRCPVCAAGQLPPPDPTARQHREGHRDDE